MPIIEVDHLTNEYRLWALQGFKQTILNAGDCVTGKTLEELPLFKTLDDVCFSVEQGEVVGLIGHKGAVNPRYISPAEVEILLGDTVKTKVKLDWTPKTTFEELIYEMEREDIKAAVRDELIKKRGFNDMNYHE